MNHDKCRSCGAAVIWCRTRTGSSIPLDAEPLEYGGNIVIRDGVAIYLKKGEPAGAAEKIYKTHFATCPNAAQHRRA